MSVSVSVCNHRFESMSSSVKFAATPDMVHLAALASDKPTSSATAAMEATSSMAPPPGLEVKATPKAIAEAVASLAAANDTGIPRSLR